MVFTRCDQQNIAWAQHHLLDILSRMPVQQRDIRFWAPWGEYLHSAIAEADLSMCLAAFIFLADELEREFMVTPQWLDTKERVLRRITRKRVRNFSEFETLVREFHSDCVNWAVAIPDHGRMRLDYEPLSVTSGGAYPSGNPPLTGIPYYEGLCQAFFFREVLPSQVLRAYRRR